MIVRRFYTDIKKRQIRKLLGNNLREARKNAGMSQTDVMQIMWGNGKNRNRISEIENGHVDINIYQFLVFLDVYGQSADYILGRSCEPINDIYAAHVNNIMLNTKNYLLPLIETMTQVTIGHIKNIDKDEHLELLTYCDDIFGYICKHRKEIKALSPQLYNLLLKISQTTKRIRMGEARREKQMYAQLESIKERHDKEDGHMLLDDLNVAHQYSLPLPEPDEEVVVTSGKQEK